jgi:hypothetical protein
MMLRFNPVRFPVPQEQRIQVTSLDDINFDDPIIVENLVSAMTAMIRQPKPSRQPSGSAQPKQED